MNERERNMSLRDEFLQINCSHVEQTLEMEDLDVGSGPCAPWNNRKGCNA